MTSYLRYKKELRTVQDADDIESWITVRGNHIPIKKGQSKEEAVKSFLKSKGGNSSAKGSLQKNELSIAYHKDKGHIKEGNPPKGWEKVEGATTAPNGYSWYSNNKSMFGGERESYLYKDKPESKYSPEFEVVRKNALANGNVYGGKYTQKSKAEAYKEYKNDTSSKENMKKANEFVNGEPKSSGKTTFYKNISGKELWSPAWKGSGRKSGYTAIENELLTEKEMEKHGFNKESSAFKKVELGKKDHHYMFGARFETKKNEKPESSGWTEHKGASTKPFNTRQELVKELRDTGYEVDNIGELGNIEFAWKDGIIYSFRLDKQSDGTIEAVKSKRAQATKKEFVEFLEKQHDYGDSDDDYYDDDNNDDNDNDGYEGITNSSEAMTWLNNQVKKHGNSYFWNEKQKSKLNKLIEKYGNTYFWNK